MQNEIQDMNLVLSKSSYVQIRGGAGVGKGWFPWSIPM